MVPGEAEKTERLNTSPYAFGAIPENELLRIKGHSKIKCAVKWAKKGKSAVEIASMYGILRITPITPEVIRISFVKGVTAKSAGYVLEAEGRYRVSVECERIEDGGSGRDGKAARHGRKKGRRGAVPDAGQQTNPFREA